MRTVSAVVVDVVVVKEEGWNWLAVKFEVAKFLPLVAVGGNGVVVVVVVVVAAVAAADGARGTDQSGFEYTCNLIILYSD